MREPTEYESNLAQKLWDYFQLGHKIKKADVIACLGNIDSLPAKRAADLYLDGWAPYLIFSGGKNGRFYDRYPPDMQGKSEAQLLADVAIEMGVPKEEILLEERSTNTGDNVQFIKERLAQEGIYPQSIISVHMPSAERRDYGTYKQVWPEVEVIIASPRVPFSKYHVEGFRGLFSKRDVITTLIGNIHRTLVYPKMGFMAEQEDIMPDNIRKAYQELIDRGYTDWLVRDGDNNIIGI